MRRCSGCGIDEVLTRFGVHRTRCLSCLRLYGRERYRSLNGDVRGYAMQQKECPRCHVTKDRTEFGEKRSGKYLAIRDVCRACAVDVAQEWLSTERGRLARIVGKRVSYAIKVGSLVRPGGCEECGAACKPDAAHSDYSKPMDVRWLCRSCHVRWDQREPKTLGRFLYGDT